MQAKPKTAGKRIREAIPPASDACDSLLGSLDALLQRMFTKRVTYDALPWDDFVRDLEAHFGTDVEPILSEPTLLDMEDRTRRLFEEIEPLDPFRRMWAADSVLARCCYLVCRLAKPRVVVETGVAYGVSSAFVLRAMETNGSGELHSVDLAPRARSAERFRGIAVPQELRSRWTLYSGSSRRLLGPLLDEVGPVDLFLHDSLHTRPNMRREFGCVWPKLRDGGIVLADDVERNTAFGELLERRPALWRVVSDRETRPLHGRRAPITFGFSVK